MKKELKHIKDVMHTEAKGLSEKGLIDQMEIYEQDRCIMVYCPSHFALNYIQRHYKDFIIKNIQESLGKVVDVEFSVRSKNSSDKQASPVSKPVQMVLPSTTQPLSIRGLNPKFTFDEFVVGKCNAFAYEAAMAVSDEGLSKYNPLYFYSDTGLGKSHIAHAIGNKVTKTKTDIMVKYTTARDFSLEYVYAVRNNHLDRFKSMYSNKCDVFFVDDVHLFKNKEKTQMELNYVLDALISNGKQVIFAGFRPPASIPYMDKGLKSRFSSGLVIDIKRPDRKTRANIVRRKASNVGISLPDDVVDFISENIRNNIRELESAVLTISAMSSLMKRKVTLDMAKELLEGTLKKQDKITIPFIQEFVAKNFGITKEELISPSRKKRIIYPRQIAIFLCRRYTKEPLQIIGEAFFRKHSSIIHSLEVVDAMYSESLKTKREIDFLIERLENATV
ncbi:MAG: chromosomal replication initiator protein DnaA [Deltaproteobacteria bacterium]|nr:chromosomal replication initiator protein DnaA [Deltaproteobacteria bacterium]